MIRMTPEGFEDFMAIIETPPTLVPEMVRILERPAPWEAGYNIGNVNAQDHALDAES